MMIKTTKNFNFFFSCRCVCVWFIHACIIYYTRCMPPPPEEEERRTRRKKEEVNKINPKTPKRGRFINIYIITYIESHT